MTTIKAVESMSLRISTDRGDAGRRLDLVLRRQLAGIDGATRTRIQQWIASGAVIVNGREVRRPATRVAAGDVVTLDVQPTVRPALAAEESPLDVVFSDEWLLAVNKPPGVVAHPTHAHAAGTLLNALAGHARCWPAGQRPSLVNRLDKLTSGIVLVARSAAAHRALQATLASPATEKDYLALVYGRVPLGGRIDLRLRRDIADRRKVVASLERGAESRTDFERLALVRLAGVTLSLVRCRLLTGRTHQIRVHLATRGWPIVGDQMYGEPMWQQAREKADREYLRSFPRQALHAWRLSFPHPMTGRSMELAAPLPADMDALLGRWPTLRAARSGQRASLAPEPT